MCSSRARPAGEGVAARTSQSKTALNCSQHCCPTCTPSRSTHSAWKPCLRDQSGARRLCGQGQGARVCLPVAVSPSPGADVARGLQEVDGSILVVASNQEDVRRIKHLCAAAPTPVTALMHAGMRCGLRTDWAALRTSERAVGHAMGLPPAGCARRPPRGHPLRVSGTRYACGGRKGGERGMAGGLSRDPCLECEQQRDHLQAVRAAYSRARAHRSGSSHHTAMQRVSQPHRQCSRWSRTATVATGREAERAAPRWEPLGVGVAKGGAGTVGQQSRR